MAKRKTEEDYHELAENRGFKWVGEVSPENSKTKTRWECLKCGHKWNAVYSNIYKGSGCPRCVGKACKTGKDYHELAKCHGFKWEGKKLPNYVRDKTQWRCKKCDRVWEANYSNISKGSGCPYCSGNVKKTEKDYHLLADSRGFKWVGKVLPEGGVLEKTWWKCKKKHRWQARYNDIYNGNGCPHCAGLAKKTKEDYHKLAKCRGFKWVGEVLPKGVHTKTWWECKKGHTFEARYDNISHGSNCPHCVNMINGQRVSKPQIKLNNLLYGSLNYPETKYRIDVAIMRKSQKIAVEYDCWYWHQGKEKQEIKRDKFLIARGWKVLHVRAGEMLPTRKQINIAIKHLLETNDSTCNLYLKDWKY